MKATFFLLLSFCSMHLPYFNDFCFVLFFLFFVSVSFCQGSHFSAVEFTCLTYHLWGTLIAKLFVFDHLYSILTNLSKYR